MWCPTSMQALGSAYTWQLVDVGCNYIKLMASMSLNNYGIVFSNTKSLMPYDPSSWAHLCF